MKLRRPGIKRSRCFVFSDEKDARSSPFPPAPPGTGNAPTTGRPWRAAPNGAGRRNARGPAAPPVGRAGSTTGGRIAETFEPGRRASCPLAGQAASRAAAVLSPVVAGRNGTGRNSRPGPFRHMRSPLQEAIPSGRPRAGTVDKAISPPSAPTRMRSPVCTSPATIRSASGSSISERIVLRNDRTP